MKKELGDDMAKPKNGRMEIRAVPGQRFDPARFRDAMSRVAAAVHIVITNGPAGLAGITATSVASITDQPPMMLFCINKTSPSAARMIENGVFLHQHPCPLARGAGGYFRRPYRSLSRQKIRGRRMDQARNQRSGAQMRGRGDRLPSCRCKDCMTHFVMIGAVEAVNFGPEGGNLSYTRRKYGIV
jgi:flavin reductase